MKLHTSAAFAALSLLFAPVAFAEQPAEETVKPTPAKVAKKRVKHRASDSKEVVPAAPVLPDDKQPKSPWRSWLPDEPAGSFTLGAMISEDRAGVYLDSITGLWAPESHDAFLFLDSRFHYEDNGQFISSTGLGFRKFLTGHNVIIGGNVFWDAISSEHDNDLNQLGLGLEVLTRWVDFRFNYYLPEDDRFEVGRSSTRRTRSGFGPGGFTSTTEVQNFHRLESGLEGFNTEIGFLIPGLDKYAEVRAYVGAYHYENPFGSDFEGVKARLEARLLRGVIANVEYWDDEALMGGHWSGELSVSLPFSLHNLFTGKNPFAGACDSFKPVPRNFSDRMGDMIVRSHRIQTVTSGDLPTSSSRSTRFTPNTGVLPPSPSRPPSGGGFIFPIE